MAGSSRENRATGVFAGTRGKDTYRDVLIAIQSGEYKPGDHLRESEVAARLGVSRTPVREALGRLQERGLVEASAGRGLAVSILSVQQILELYAMREELEGISARLAANQVTRIEVDNLERLNEEFLSASDPKQAAEANRLFHGRLHDAARNRYLTHALDDLSDTIALLPSTTFSLQGRAEVAHAEHAAIIKGLRDRDPAAAGTAASAHIRAALRARLQMIR